MSDPKPTDALAPFTRAAWRMAGLAMASVIVAACIAAAHRLLLWGWP